MLCLSIETSCDETSLAILYNSNFANSLGDSFVNYINSFTVLGQIISSQINLHKNFGGVIPEIGAREHANQIHFLFQEVLQISLENWNKTVQNMSQNLDQNVEQNIKEIKETQKTQPNQGLNNNFNFQNSSKKSTIIKDPDSQNLWQTEEKPKEKIEKNKLNLSQNFAKKKYDEKKHCLSDIFVNLEYIFVTTTPGLTSALKVGIEFAKTLEFFVEQNYQKKVKIIPINHLQGHVVSSFWQK